VTRARHLLVAGLLAGLVCPPSIDAQPAPTSASAVQRAEALIGLGRVAATRRQWREAHDRFTESARLRPLDVGQQEEHFWVAVHVDRDTALGLARSLADRKAASREVFVRWIDLLGDDEDAIGAVLAVADAAAAAVPNDPAWIQTRASVAVRAERAGQTAVAARAWSGVPAVDREARADWQASFLRVSAAQTSRAALAPEFDRYVAAHPADDGMRALAVEAWADAGQPLRGLDLLGPRLGRTATAATLRRAADLARQGRAESRARALLERVHATGGATEQDTWTLATLLAAERDSAALRRLFVTYPPTPAPCADRLIEVALASGDDEVLADLVPALPTACRAYGEVAPRVARVLIARGRTDRAETWLAPMAHAGTLDDAGRLVYARALAARQAWRDVDALLAGLVVGRDDAVARQAADLVTWAWHGLGRSREAWQLATRLLSPERDAVDARAGWAALAWAAGDRAAAVRLADAVLGSARDVDARAVRASMAAADGQPRDVRRWLDPVSASLTDPGHVLLLVDAIDALDGPTAARRAAGAYPAIVSHDATLLGRRSVWAAASGELAAAAADAALVRALDAGMADRLDVSLAVMADEGLAAWTAVTRASTADVAAAPHAWARLRFDAAIASRRWADADAALEAFGADLDDGARALATARLHLGREGGLDDGARSALAHLVAQDRHVRAATVLLATDDVARREYAAALGRLPWSIEAPGASAAATDIRILAAEALLGLGRAADVVRIVSSGASEPAALQVLWARAQIALGHGATARARLETLAVTRGRADAALALADLIETSEARLAMLAEAHARHPDHRDLHLRYAEALRLTGDTTAARAEASAVLRQVPSSREAWRVVVASAATARSATLVDELRQAREALGTGPDVSLLLAEAVAQAPQVSDAGVDLVVSWFAEVPESHAIRAWRVQAALGVAAGRWPLAQEAIGRLETLVPPSDTSVLRLRADVTAWSGAHAAAVPLFAAYLEREPADAAAWRQYARLLTWRDDRLGAEQAYARAQALTPVPGVDAEARTRLAILRRDWPEAVGAAAAWRSHEPATLDALVDLALALEQSGDVAGATRAYDELARWPSLPDTVRRTLAAYEWRRAPHGVGGVEIDHAEGFEGQRLLERRETAATADASVTHAGTVRVFGRLGQGRLDTGVDDPAYLQGQAGIRTWLARGITAEARLGTTRLGGDDAMLGGLRVAGPVARHVAVEASVARQPFWENAATVASGLQAWTTGVRVRTLGTGAWDASVGADYSALSDGLGRQQLDASVGRTTNRGPRQVELRASAFVFGFSEPTGAYFSPSAFGRLDLEAAVQQWCGQGAAVRDGRFALRGRLGSGVDTNGVPYVLAGGGLVVPITGPFAVAAEGRWTSSRVYRAWSGIAGVQVGTSRDAVPGRTR
jgi:tetratricopeptide (TPR) repeat protein